MPGERDAETVFELDIVRFDVGIDFEDAGVL